MPPKTAKLLRVVRADAVIDGDETHDGKAIAVASVAEHPEHEAARAAQDAPDAEIVGSSPQEVTLSITGGGKVTLSPSDLIVVLR